MVNFMSKIYYCQYHFVLFFILKYLNVLNVIVLYLIALRCVCILFLPYRIVSYDIVLLPIFFFVSLRCDIVPYCVLSHAKEDTGNQKPGKPLHILRYADW